MKRIAVVLLLAASSAVTSARADHIDFRGSVNVGVPVYAPAPVYSPGYYAPGYYRPERGYWRDVAVNVYVPGHWAERTDWYGRPANYWVPAHYEVRTQRVWVDADRARQEWTEHERREHREREHRDYWGR